MNAMSMKNSLKKHHYRSGSSIYSQQRDDNSYDLQRSNSVILNNKLTKQFFSVYDTSLHTSNQTMKDAVKKIMKKHSHHKVEKIDRMQRYKTVENVENVGERFYSVTETAIPRLNFRRKNEASLEKVKESQRSIRKTKSQHGNKFKLLFKDNTNTVRKTASQRKIDRLDWKIKAMEEHRKYLQNLKPKPKKMIIPEKVLPRGTIVEPERIIKLAKAIRDNLQLYFNMYPHPKKVGDLLKAVQGYNKVVHDVIFENRMNARRIKKDSEITNSFWVFKERSAWPEFYGEQDLNLFNILQNFSMKMDKNFQQIKKNYVQFESIKTESIKKQIAKKLDQYEKIREPHPQISQINNFIEKRKRHNQDRRESSLSKLERLGVRFNVEQRSKDLIVREKEKVMGNFFIKKFKKN